MAQDVIAAGLGHQRLAGAANGVVLGTSAVFTGFIRGTEYIDLIPRNFSTAVVARYALCPYLVVLKADTSDDLVSTPLDYTEAAQDGSTATSVDVSGLAAGRFLYIGSAIPFRGVNIDVDATNSTGSTALTVRYWDGVSWVDLSDSDGTSSTVSLDQDGSVTWTVPTAWVSANLVKINATLNIAAPADFQLSKKKMYWTRWQWSQNLDSTVTLDHMLGINESIAYAEVPVGIGTGMRVHHGFGTTGFGGIEALTDAGTGNLLIICSALNGYFSVAPTSGEAD